MNTLTYFMAPKKLKSKRVKFYTLDDVFHNVPLQRGHIEDMQKMVIIWRVETLICFESWRLPKSLHLAFNP
jgi:hypothetical protein